MSIFDEFPFETTYLRNFALHASQQKCFPLVGAHLRRAQGLSLEFREFRDYLSGDEFRHIDWYASARNGKDNEWVVRSFQVERQLTMAISVDNRVDTALPLRMTKLRVGFWLAQALATIAVIESDNVVMHRLYGQAGSVQCYRGQDPYFFRTFFDKSEAELQHSENLNCHELEPFLPPAAIWVIITDLYGPETEKLAQFVARKQQGSRWVIVVELDSWLMEKALLLKQPTRAMSSRVLGKLEVQLDENQSKRVASRIDERRQKFLHTAQHGGFSHMCWQWPEQAPVNLGDWFMDKFISDPVIRRVFQGVT